MKVVAAIGRWMPLHNGHKKFLLNFFKEYDKVIILIGSCYEGGTSRNCITAVKREKIINAVLQKANISKDRYKILHVPDTEEFDEWFNYIKEICKTNHVTHFCTGNREDILDILKEKNEKLKFEIINPEEKSDFPYHASDIRKLIIEEKFDEAKKLIPEEISSRLFNDICRDIKVANQNCGIIFGKGKQTSYIIFIVKNINDNKVYILLRKESFPGGEIKMFESPINSAVDFLCEYINVNIIDNSDEPAIIKILDSKLDKLYNLGIYNLEADETAQIFSIYIEDDLNKYVNNKTEFYEINEKLSERYKNI